MIPMAVPVGSSLCNKATGGRCRRFSSGGHRGGDRPMLWAAVHCILRARCLVMLLLRCYAICVATVLVTPASRRYIVFIFRKSD